MTRTRASRHPGRCSAERAFVQETSTADFGEGTTILGRRSGTVNTGSSDTRQEVLHASEHPLEFTGRFPPATHFIYQPGVGWDACESMFALGYPNREDSQEMEGARQRTWWLLRPAVKKQLELLARGET